VRRIKSEPGAMHTIPSLMTQNSPAPCGLMEQIRNGPVAELGPRQGRSTLSQWGSSAKEAVEC